MLFVSVPGPPRPLYILLILSMTFSACGSGSPSGGGPPPPPPAAEFLYASGTSDVIAFSIDTTTGALNQTAEVAEADNTVGIITNPSESFLYVSDKGDGIDGFTIGQSGGLSTIVGSPWPGSPTYYGGGLAMNPGGTFIYAAPAVGPPGVVVGFSVDETTGALTAIPGSPFSAGIAPAQPVVDRSGKFLYVADIAQGGILAFTINATTGALTAVAGSPFPTLPLAEPNGLAAEPSGNFLYASLFADSSIAAFTINSTTGSLTSVAGSPFATGADQSSLLYSIAVDPAGKFLYAMSGAFSRSVVSVFTIDSTNGTLTPVNGSPFTAVPSEISGGLAVDPSGKFLYIAGGSVTAIFGLSIDGTTGALTPISGTPIPSLSFPANLTVVSVP